MTTIKLELPESNATVLYHFGEALRSIAVHEGFVAPSNDRKTTISKTIGDMNYTVTDEPVVVAENVTPPEVEERDIDHDCEASVGEIEAHEERYGVELNSPWDQRIHSRGKTQLADGTWRYARKPNDKTKEEWDLYVKEVETELVALMAIPVAIVDTDTPHGMSEANEEIVTPAVVETPEIVTPEIVTPEIVTPEIVTPEIVTPEIVTPAVVETPAVVATGPQNFGELMRFITANGKKLNNDIVKEVLAENGLASIALLAARNDLIPQIHQALLGKL